ncbi:MAG TPA: SIS domain-containing protein [Hyphomicrobiaceae bacterium]|jgi:D-sedoheptulose 7-phosphate isomerase|nr:SIS domain-containing protein [Hyphomicrobiaceae bacterium]
MVPATLTEYLTQSRQALDVAMTWPGMSAVDDAVALIGATLAESKPLMVCGNGGSASDAMHIAGELVGRFLRERKAINCICLASNPAVLTAWSNDYSYDTVFARQVEAYGKSGGVLLGISTSGDSVNVVQAFEKARALGVRTVALTGEGGGALAPLSDILIDVPSRRTPIIQQLHVCVYHYICERLEARLGAA